MTTLSDPPLAVQTVLGLVRAGDEEAAFGALREAMLARKLPPPDLACQLTKVSRCLDEQGKKEYYIYFQIELLHCMKWDNALGGAPEEQLVRGPPSPRHLIFSGSCSLCPCAHAGMAAQLSLSH